MILLTLLNRYLLRYENAKCAKIRNAKTESSSLLYTLNIIIVVGLRGNVVNVI